MRAPLGFLALVVCWACGGSSSETPPPLEPDPERLKPVVPGEASEPSPGGAEGEVLQPAGEQRLPAGEPPLRGGSAAPARRGVPPQTWGAAPRRAAPRAPNGTGTPSPAKQPPAAPGAAPPSPAAPPPELAPEPEL